MQSPDEKISYDLIFGSNGAFNSALLWIDVETLLLIATWIFIITNIDVLVLLVAFCADDRYELLEVATGHLVSFCIGTGLAIAAAVVAAEYFAAWTFVLGTIPLALGIWTLLRRRQAVGDGLPAINPTSLGRASVVFVACLGLVGENLALYIPFFADLSISTMLFVGIGYLFGAGLLVIVAITISRRLVVVETPQWVDQLLVPLVLIVVGLYVLFGGWVLA